MNPPPIRYPLPTLIAIMAVALLAWRGDRWSRPWREAVATRWTRAVEGPPPGRSIEPKVVVDGIARRVLLLGDETPTAEVPGGPKGGAIGRRGWVDVYDIWPNRGEPTHFRVGVRRPIGWVEAADVIDWPTRLVIRAPGGRVSIADQPSMDDVGPVEVGDVPMPVLQWSADAVRVATWKPGAPWSAVGRVGWVRSADLMSSAWGAWMSRDEVLIALDRATRAVPGPTRLDAIFGRLGVAESLSPTDQAVAAAFLPRTLGEIGVRPDASADLARINEGWTPDAAWSGLQFRMIPLDLLPDR